MTKTEKKLSIAFFIGLAFVIGMVAGMQVKEDMTQIIIEMDNPEILKLAMEYHGIDKCYVDSDGVYYFFREGQWCSLYSIPFRQWYVQRVEGDK